MNFIYTILSFALTSIICFSISAYIPYGNVWNTFTAVGVISLIATVVSLFAAMFQNMYFRKDVNRDINRIKEYKRDAKSLVNEMESYKDEISGSMTKLYPEYEKEMFKNMSPSDAEHISAILVKYPELKFNGVLEKYTSKLSYYISEINERERDVNSYVRRIDNIETCGWVIGKIKKPDFVNKLMEQSYE